MSSEVNSGGVRSGARRYVLWGLLGLLALGPMLALFVLPMNPADERRLMELRHIADEMPLHPYFRQEGTSEIAKGNGALVLRTYRAPAYSTSYEQVNTFYVRELTARGWERREEDAGGGLLKFGPKRQRLVFRKGAYYISIGNEEGSSEYSVGYGWEKP